MRKPKIWRSVALGLAGSLLLTGCGGADFDVYELPLPGGTDVGDDPITVTVAFNDVLDLVPKSTVKVNDVNVGQVTDVRLAGFDAEVDVVLRNDVALPDNAVAEIRQTSLLGEKFVQLSPPPSGAEGELEDGETIPLSRTGRNPEVEEVLGALSLVLNGGGVAQLNTITTELNKVLEGREDTTRSLLRQIDSFMSQLDDNKGQIVDAIRSLNRLSLAVREQQPSIDNALEQLPSALDSLNRQRDDLIRMLTALDDLGDVAVGVIRRSKAVTIETLQQLEPVLTELANSGDDVVDAFNVFLTYPFVDEVVGRDPQVARNLHMGDYTNLSVRLEIDLSDPLTSLPVVPIPCNIVGNESDRLKEELARELEVIFQKAPNTPLADALNQALAQIDTEGACEVVNDFVNGCFGDGVTNLTQNCRGLLRDVCKAAEELTGQPLPFCEATGGLVPINEILDLIGGVVDDNPDPTPTPSPGNPLGGLPGVDKNGGGRSGGGGAGGILGGGGGGLLGTNRAAFGPPAATSGPTLGQLVEVYDPALTTLLVPGMVTR